MPPAKRRAPVQPLEPPTAAPRVRQSKLAKEHNITNAEETEIREAFALFATPKQGEKEGVIPIGDVRRALIALNIPPTPLELTEFLTILDPDSEGFAMYSSFVAICALKFRSRTRTSDSHELEVEEAFRLFTRAGVSPDEDGDAGGGDRITMATLRRVAKLLRQDVGDDFLRDMILEANGGAEVAKGVAREEFEAVVRKGGIWG